MMTHWFQNASLRRKQLLISLLTCSVALCLACAAFVAYDTITFRQSTVTSLSSFAEVIGENTAAAIDFNDSSAAEATLAALRNKPTIIMADVHLMDGRLFARYLRNPAIVPEEIPNTSSDHYEFINHQLHLFRPILRKGEQVGTIELISSLDELRDRMWRYAIIVAVVFLGSLLGAFWLSTRLERFVSEPIRNLAQVARSIAQAKNYSVRAAKQSNDELGQLVDGFNEMLAQIQVQDAALQASRDSLEERVRERTAELEQATAAVVESQSLYHSLVEHLPAGVFRKDFEGRYVFVNSLFCRLKDLPADKILGKTPQELAAYEATLAGISPAQHELHVTLAGRGTDHHQMILQTSEPIALEEMYPQSDGTTLYFQAIKSPVFSSNKKITGTQGILFDITERKQASEKLALSLSLLNATLESMADGIVAVDLAGNIISYNSKFAAIWQFPPGVLESRSAAETRAHSATLTKDPAAFMSRLEELQTTPEAESFDVIELKDGRTFERYVFPQKISGKCVGTVINWRDITERKRAEAELRAKTALLEAQSNSTPDGLLVVDKQGQRLFSNQRLNEIWKIPRHLIADNDDENMLQHIVSTTRHPEQFLQKIRYLYDHADEISRDEIELKDGTVLDRYSSPVIGKDGTHYGRIWLFRDVSKEKWSEAELAYERDLLRTLLDNSPDPIYFKDAQSRFIKTSKAHAESFGLKSAEELVGKSDFEFFSAAHARPAFEDEQEIIRTGQPLIGKIEKEMFKNGRVSWALTNKMPLRNQHGAIVGTFGISKNITAIKETELKLLESKQFLQSTLDALSAHIAILDENGTVIALNAMWAQFAQKNRFLGSNYGIGSNYLQVCDSATGECSTEAADVAAGIRSVLAGGAKEFEKEYPCHSPQEKRWFVVRVTRFEASGPLRVVVAHENVTERKRAEAEVAQMHTKLLETSRQAGMAEVATGVLHNVGNVLNSVNVSSTLVADNLKKSKIANLPKVVALLHEHAADLGDYLTHDPKGSRLPGYLAQLSNHLATEQAAVLTELAGLQKNVEHIKEIVAMQQSYAKVSGVTETLKATDLVEDALRMNASALERHDIQVIRELADLPPINVDKHKVLQILVNLIRNAKYACDESGRPDRQLKVRVTNGENRIKISIIDNGIGIPRENLVRIFSHGFTTRKDGHGFGLHSGALAAKELGGALVAHSDGLGTGATFTLELPLPLESTATRPTAPQTCNN